MKCPRCGLINPETASRCDCGYNFESKGTGNPNLPTTSPPPYSLFDHRAVGVATFFGSPLAGSILMALNYRRIGIAGAAARILVAGIVLTGLLVALGRAVPSGASTILGPAVLAGVVYGAKALQGDFVEQHTRSGGRLVSRWAAFGIGLAVLVPIVIGTFAYLRVATPSTKVVIGTKDLVYYSGDAREQDAAALGQALRSDGFFQNKGASALVSKAKGAFTVSFVVKDGFWEDPKHIAAFEELGRQIAPAIGGLPLDVRLVNSRLEPKKEVTVRPIVFTSYEDASRGIRIKVPQDWTIRDGDSLVVSAPGGTNVSVLVKATPYTLEDYTKRNIAEIRRIHEMNHDFVLRNLEDPKSTAVAGSPAYAVVYTMKVKEVPAKGWQIWTVKNKKAYLVTLTAGEQLFDTYLPIAKEMVASMAIR